MSELENEDLTEEQVAALDAEGAPEPDPDPDDDPAGGAPQPEETQPEDSGLAMEKMGKSLDALQRHVAKRITDILGDVAGEWEECEICNYWNTPGWRHKGPLPQEVENVLYVALNQASPRALKKDEYSRVCDKCDGYGVVSTDAKVQGQESLQCLGCKGMGWVPVGSERASGAFATVNGPAAAPPAQVTPQPSAVPESPEVAAAKAVLAGAGWMTFPPITPGV